MLCILILYRLNIYICLNFRCFQTSQENQYSSDRTNNIRAKTIYSNVVNLAQNGGVWHKADGSIYTGNIYLRYKYNARFN